MTVSPEKKEQVYLKIFWLLLGVMVLDLFFVYTLPAIEGVRDRNLLLISVACLIVFHGIRHFMAWKGQIDLNQYAFAFRLAEIFSLLAICQFFENQSWLYMSLIFPMTITAFNQGVKKAVVMAGVALLLHFSYLGLFQGVIVGQSWTVMIENFKDFAMFYMLSMLIVFLLVGVLEAIGPKEQPVTEESLDVIYSKLMETNQMLEDSNTQLAETNAELYTIQVIVKDINGIMNIRDLSLRVNDIILGIMGVSSVSLLFIDHEKKKLKLYANTLQEWEEQTGFVENLQCDILFKTIEKGVAYYDNHCQVARYPFLKGRNTGSLMLVPLSQAGNKVGIAILEHRLEDYFSDKKLRFMEVVGQQISLAFEKVTLYSRVLDIAVRDGLTGVYNRVYFQQRLNDEIKRAKKSGHKVTLAILDIDHFKNFNDTFGHTFGDKVIKHTVDVVKSSLRKGDVVARFGGEEFVIILPSAGAQEASKKIEQIRESIEREYIRDHGVEASITASFGIASFPETATSEDELIRAADEALYLAKKSGRNCVKVFQSS